MVVYNFSWTIHATADELSTYESESSSLPQAFMGGSFLLLGFIASVYHLCFMAGLRMYAISLPLKYKTMKNKTVIYCLGFLWLFSAVAATSPGKRFID